MRTLKTLSILLVAASIGGGCRGEPKAPAARAVPGQGSDEHSRPPPSATPHPGGTLHLASRIDLPTLDPAIGDDADTVAVEEMVLDTLTGYALDGTTLEPHLAVSWALSADGRTYTFTLRPEASFEDGTPVTADDVKASLERVLAPATASPGASFYLDLDGAADFRAGRAADVRGIVVRGPREIAFTLAAPSASFPYRLAMKFAAPQPRSALGQAGGTGERPVATGPFRVARYVPGARIELARNPSYWCRRAGVAACRDLPYVDGITIDLGQAGETQVMRLERGELDLVADVPHAMVSSVLARQSDALRPQIGPVLATSEIVLDTAVAPLDDPTVRRALNLAVSKHRLNRVSSGLLVPSACVLPPGIEGHDDEAVALYPYDPDQARSLLAQSGHAGFTLEIAAAESSVVLDSVVADLRAAGVDARVRLYAPSAFFQLLGKRGALQAAYASYAADYPAADDLLDAQLGSARATGPDATNWSFYADPALDGLLDRARGERDPAVRRGLYVQAEQKVRDAAPWIFLGYEQALLVTSQRVHGAVLHPLWQRELAGAWLDPMEAAR